MGFQTGVTYLCLPKYSHPLLSGELSSLQQQLQCKNSESKLNLNKIQINNLKN